MLALVVAYPKVLISIIIIWASTTALVLLVLEDTDIHIVYKYYIAAKVAILGGTF